MRENIKNLIIDLGGVLIDLDPSRCIKSFKQLGVSDIDKLISPYYHQQVFSSLEKGEISVSVFYDKLRELTGKPLTDNQINKAWTDFLVGIPSNKLDLLLYLKQKYRIYLLSNTNEIHWKYICDNFFSCHTDGGTGNYFDKTYLSYELHQLKPDKNIFLSLLADAEILPEETFFIDDSIENCKMAQSLGISAYTPVAKENWSHLFDKQ